MQHPAPQICSGIKSFIGVQRTIFVFAYILVIGLYFTRISMIGLVDIRFGVKKSDNKCTKVHRIICIYRHEIV